MSADDVGAAPVSSKAGVDDRAVVQAKMSDVRVPDGVEALCQVFRRGDVRDSADC